MHTDTHPRIENAHDSARHDATRSSMFRIRGVLASLVLFAAALELSLGAMQRFSFPYLPLFRPDATLGVALDANASARVRTREGHITTVRTNAQGFRGAPHVAPVRTSGESRRRILVVGDSQAMGLHVEGHETLTVALEEALPASTVMNAAVPTYGPLEYATLVERSVRPLAIDDVIVLFAPANDFLEARVENRVRTTAALGFAARVTRPHDVTQNDDERALTSRLPNALGRSHVVYAVRRILGVAGAEATVVDAPSFLARNGAKLLHVSPREPSRRGDDAAEFRSRLGPALARIAAACVEARCRVHASVLPLDVEIEPNAWRKYTRGPAGHARDEIRASVPDIVHALRAAAGDDMSALGIVDVDLIDALRHVAPGAFLDDDDHLSARGHAAVARAFADALRSSTVNDIVARREKEPT